ncbi:MAG: sigma 54-interacting transcriptional regulator, partial [Chloroflexi bacterium]|nr:sigma 54-interacting transcriptional regulator [Chloroflexota bacterium]
IVLLLDSTACLLEALGDPDTLAGVTGMGVRPGVFLDEGRIGTSAFGVALMESSPVQMVGPEHFLACFHDLSTAAAPIFDLQGHPVGTFGLLETAARRSAQSLGVVVSAARAIENQLQADLFVREANTHATELNAIMDSMSDGVLAWTVRGTILHLNNQAGKLLGLTPASVVGRPLVEYLTLPEGLAQALTRGEELNDVDIGFKAAGNRCECLVSLRLICGPEREPLAYIATLRRIEQVRQLVNRLVGAQARLTLDDLVGNSPASRRIRRQALAVTDARACVLLRGESGTSKNVLARAIHNSSRRAGGPFLALNCRAIPRELALGEFLGFEAGAFNSGPSAGQPSKFELADGGTLLLEEVEALPRDMQAALLRVIEAGDVIRLGGTRVIPVDVRVIASSTADLEARVAEDVFRADLLFRLSSFVITTTPLRERPEDIPLLIERLLEKLSVQVGRPLTLSAQTRAALCAYPWPGNVRELESVIERAVLLCDGPEIRPEHLPEAIRQRRAIVPHKPLTEPVRSLAEAERVAILSAGRAARGNLTQASQYLGIGRTTLWRKMKEFNLSARDFHPAA